MSFVTDETRYGDNGNLLTTALFVETNRFEDKYPPVFTLKEYAAKGCVSFYQEYMQHDSEYAAAVALLGSWTHWLTLRKCSWFKPYYEQWEGERLERDKAIAKQQLKKNAASGNVTAQRILYGVPPEERNKKKRVTKKEAAEQAAQGSTDKELEKLHKEVLQSKTH